MDDVAEIKQRVDIVDLVGQYVSLKKAGANFKGLCPFHHERTSSFMVNPERQIFKCFGCNKGGDIFTFIQEVENVEFGDALKMLADKAGVTLKPKAAPKPGEAPSQKTRSYQINALATQLFHKLLLEHPVGQEARDYLAKRGLTKETIKLWRIGYAPRKKVLTDFLIKRGFSPQEIQTAGKPDMFYDRIMFPINDVIGNVVGFTGRILGQGEPKYLNTPETPIFRKSQILFGLDKARQAIKQTNQVILAEGQMDVISAYQAGSHQIVATSGTALTQQHLRILHRYEADIIFAFDADSAGQAATWRAIDLAIQDGLSVKVIPIPAPAKDIGDLVSQNATAWLELAKQPIPAIEWQINNVFGRYQSQGGINRKLSVDEKKQIAKELLPVLRHIPDTIEQAHYSQLLAKRLDMTEATIRQALSQQKTAPPAKAEEAQPVKKALTGDETLLGLLARSKDWQNEYPELYKSLVSCYTGVIQDLIFAVEEYYRGLSPAELKNELTLLVRRYEEAENDRLKDEYAQKIQQAQVKGDREAMKQLLARFQKLLH